MLDEAGNLVPVNQCRDRARDDVRETELRKLLNPPGVHERLFGGFLESGDAWLIHGSTPSRFRIAHWTRMDRTKRRRIGASGSSDTLVAGLLTSPLARPTRPLTSVHSHWQGERLPASRSAEMGATGNEGAAPPGHHRPGGDFRRRRCTPALVATERSCAEL